MIPRAYITQWRAKAPWGFDTQVEQDLVLSRAVVEIFSDERLGKALAFRGGTALHKLYFDPPGRYSEDIDLVQIEAGPAGSLMTALHERLNPWLGKPGTKQGAGRVTFIYRFESESLPVSSMRLKVEINTREHFDVLGLVRKDATVESRWFTGQAQVTTYAVEELLGTKLRALYQRKKGRDVFDLALALERFPGLDTQALVHCFGRYMAHSGRAISRAEFEANLHDKRGDADFIDDITALLSTSAGPFDPREALDLVRERLVAKLPGEPWKGVAP